MGLLLSTFTSKIQASGRVLLYGVDAATVELRFECLGIQMGLITQTSLAGKVRCVVIPSSVRQQLPDCEIAFQVFSTSLEAGAREQCLVSVHDELRARVVVSAHKLSLSVNLPSVITRGLQALQWSELKVRLVSGKSVDVEFVGSLRLNNQGHGRLPIPAHLDSQLEAGDSVVICLRSVVFIKPTSEYWFADTLFDLALTIPAGVVVEPDGDFLILSTNYARSFRVRRRVPIGVWLWLCGVYQAEGSKEGLSFYIPQKLPALLRDVLALLVEQIGLPRERFYVDVTLRNDTTLTEETAREHYSIIGAEIRNVKSVADGHPEDRSYRPAAGTQSAALHFAESITLLRMFNTTLSRLIDIELERIPTLGAIAFAIGFLDGDGTIIVHDSTCVHFAGDEREIRAACFALEHGLGWQRRDAMTLLFDPGQSIRRRLDVRETADLISAGAFKYSLSRAKLLHVVKRRCDWLGTDTPAHHEWPSIWSELELLLPTVPTLDDAIQHRKGLPNPMLGTSSEQIVDEQRKRWLFG